MNELGNHLLINDIVITVKQEHTHFELGLLA